MRLLVVNPNTSASMTQRIGAAAGAAAGPGVEVVAVNPAHGPASIEGYFDEVFAAPGWSKKWRRATAPVSTPSLLPALTTPGWRRRARPRAGRSSASRGGVSRGRADRPSLQRRHHPVAIDRANRGQSGEIRPRDTMRARARLRSSGAGARRRGFGRARKAVGGNRMRHGGGQRRGDRARLRRYGRSRRHAGAPPRPAGRRRRRRRSQARRSAGRARPRHSKRGPYAPPLPKPFVGAFAGLGRPTRRSL